MFAWNMFDWAAMDTPCDGAVTHLNCFAVLALSETAAFLQEFGEPRAAQYRTLADSINAAINRLLWDENRRAYADCLRYRDGKRVLSGVFSQQTQTVAFMSGAAQGERKERCRALMEAPEEGFVRAGSPFFEFFYLEAMMRRGDDAAFIGDLTRSWGKMIDTGCDTFWEMWTYAAPDGRLTRSHCHGWSAAPVIFWPNTCSALRPSRQATKKCAFVRTPAGSNGAAARSPRLTATFMYAGKWFRGKCALRAAYPKAWKLNTDNDTGGNYVRSRV